MRIIAVASQKGGSGKTTLSGHLAVQAEAAGHGPVALIDTDPQGSLSAWWNARVAETPLFARTTLADLPDDLAALREAGIALVVIDTPPAITTAIGEVIRVADFVVIPTRPSPHDLRAVGATVQLVRRCGKPLVFVVNDATPRARITSEAAIALSQHGTVAPVTIHHRTEFASSMIDGRTVGEVNGAGRSALEVKALWDYLDARLREEAIDMPFHLHDARAAEGAGRIAAAKAAAPAAPAPAVNATAGPMQARPKAGSLTAARRVVPPSDPAVLRALEAVEDAAAPVPPAPAPAPTVPSPSALSATAGRPASVAGRGFGRRVI